MSDDLCWNTVVLHLIKSDVLKDFVVFVSVSLTPMAGF